MIVYDVTNIIMYMVSVFLLSMGLLLFGVIVSGKVFGFNKYVVVLLENCYDIIKIGFFGDLCSLCEIDNDCLVVL